MRKLLLFAIILITNIGFAQSGFTKDFQGAVAHTVYAAVINSGQSIISCTGEKVYIWDYNTQKVTRSINLGVVDDNYYLCFSLSPDEKIIAGGSKKNEIKLWDVQTGKVLKTLIGHKSSDENGFNGVTAVSFSADSKFLVSGSSDNTAKLWDITNGKCIKTFAISGDNSVSAVGISQDGSKISSGASDGGIKIWDSKTGQVIKTLTGHTDFVRTAMFNPDGQKIISSSYDGTVKLWDINTGKTIREFVGHGGQIEWAGFDPSGNLVASCDFESIKLWETETGKCLKTFNVAVQIYVGFSLDGKYIVSTTGTAGLAFDPDDKSNDYPHVYLCDVSQFKTKAAGVDVDIQIPQSSTANTNTFAVIIANENYGEEAKVSYALNDGTIFKKYCEKTLGIPSSNIHLVLDATMGDILSEKDWLANNLKAYKGEAKAIFYYAGHGIPGGQDQPAYLLPVDGSSENLSSALMLDDLYNSLTLYQGKGVTVFLDACFSGSNRDMGMLASARGTKLKPRESTLPGNMVVFSAASGDETAWPYKDKQHGMFTYYLLKKLQESRGDITYKELSEYLSDNVYKASIRLNNKPQTPTVKAGVGATGWEGRKLK